MAVYYGVIKNNRVVLDTDVQLAEGMPVEIRPRLSASNPEDAFKKLLLAEGLMTEPPSSEPMSPGGCDGLSLSKASPCLRRLSPRGASRLIVAHVGARNDGNDLVEAIARVVARRFFALSIARTP